MPYNLDPISAGCYPGTTILINKFDIRDEAQLTEIEIVLVTTRTTEWEISPKRNDFSFEHYKAVHNYLFSELYEWAGRVRTVNISKKGAQFCPAENIEALAAQIFARLKYQNYLRNMPHKDFIDAVSDFYNATNYLHPFREGNGRAQRLFISQLVRSAGYELNFSDLDIDLLMIATIQAAQGVTDLLRQILIEAIH